MPDAPVVRDAVTTVFLVRHGRTRLNAAGLLRGQEDVPLDEVGLAEVERLGDAFAGVDLARIVTSPLQRAVATGAAIARHHGLAGVTDAGLLDRDYGEGTGRSRADVDATWGGLDSTPGAEPMAVFAARVREAFVRLATRPGDRPTLLVAHDAVNAVLLADVVGHPVDQHTACWNQLESVDGTWRAVAINQIP